MNLQFGDKITWQHCEMLFDKTLSYGLSLIERGLLPFEFEAARTEYAVGSRYLHRGFYCPSLILDQIVGGLRRGRIAKRITKATQISNIYDFDADGRLRIAKTAYYTGHMDCEYILYDKCMVYGFVLQEGNTFSHLSVERYNEGRIASYFTADCICHPSSQYYVFNARYEAYRYNDADSFDVEHYYFSTPGCSGDYYKNTYRNAPHGEKPICLTSGGWRRG